MPVDPDKVTYPVQLGDMKLEANLEFRFPIWGIFHGATFFDVGNIWFMGNSAEEYPPEAVFHIRDFYKQLGFTPASASGSTSSSPCCAWTGVFSCTSQQSGRQAVDPRLQVEQHGAQLRRGISVLTKRSTDGKRLRFVFQPKYAYYCNENQKQSAYEELTPF